MARVQKLGLSGPRSGLEIPAVVPGVLPRFPDDSGQYSLTCHPPGFVTSSRTIVAELEFPGRFGFASGGIPPSAGWPSRCLVPNHRARSFGTRRQTEGVQRIRVQSPVGPV